MRWIASCLIDHNHLLSRNDIGNEEFRNLRYYNIILSGIAFFL